MAEKHHPRQQIPKESRPSYERKSAENLDPKEDLDPIITETLSIELTYNVL